MPTIGVAEEYKERHKPYFSLECLHPLKESNRHQKKRLKKQVYHRVQHNQSQPVLERKESHIKLNGHLRINWSDWNCNSFREQESSNKNTRNTTERLTEMQKAVKKQLMKIDKQKSFFIQIRNHNKRKEMGLCNQFNFFQGVDLIALREIKRTLAYFLQPIKSKQKRRGNAFDEYMKLVEQSRRYLIHYYRDSVLAAEQPLEDFLLLIILKNAYPCLMQPNQAISNRILLAFKLNPLNDLQCVSWEKYRVVRNILSQQYTMAQGKSFLIAYFFTSAYNIPKSHWKLKLPAIKPKAYQTEQKEFQLRITSQDFWGTVEQILRKASEQKIIEDKQIDNMISKLKENTTFALHQTTLTKKQLSSNSLFIWDELLQVILM